MVRVKTIGFVLLLLMMAFFPFVRPGEGSGFRMDSNLKDAHASFIGEEIGDTSGDSAAGGGDVNGDGYDDMIIGATVNDEGGTASGQVYVIFGKASGWEMDTNLDKADASFIGEAALQWAGSDLAIAGDVNGDGYDDILIGAPINDEGGTDAGQVYLVLGKETGWSMDVPLSKVDASFIGEDPDDEVGTAISGAGDIDGDGFDDILIGCRKKDEGDTNAGKAYIIFGRSGGWNMDTSLSQAGASFIGEKANDYFGSSVSGAGDVNGDGLDDLVISAVYNDESATQAGKAYLVLGRPSGWSKNAPIMTFTTASFLGEMTSDSIGSVTGIGDVNGDGYDDFTISSIYSAFGGGNSGQTYLVFGRASGWKLSVPLSEADASFFGEASADFSGSISKAGDVNKDGLSDIIIGAIQNDEGGTDAGQTYLILGKTTGWAMRTPLAGSDASFIGEVAGDMAGSHAFIGDVNGDGFDDILISAHNNDDGGNNAGQSYVIFYDSKPSPPPDVVGSLSGDGGRIDLKWDVPEYYKYIDGFNIYRSMDGSRYNLIKNLERRYLTFSDTDLMLYQTYYYYVTCTAYPRLESDPSNIVVMYNDLDTDGDGLGDFKDPDIDGDGVENSRDAFPKNASETNDIDRDGLGDNGDTDDDNDGIPDLEDERPLDPTNALYDHLDVLQGDISDVKANITLFKEQIAVLESEMNAFKLETAGSLENLIINLTQLDIDISSEMAVLNASLADLEGANLTEMEEALYSIQEKLSRAGYNDTELLGEIDDIRMDISSFQTNTTAQFQTLSSILTRLEALERLLEEEDEDDGGDMIETVLLVIGILLLLVLILLVLVRKKEGRKNMEE